MNDENEYSRITMKRKPVDLNDLIGQFGPYHFNLMLFSFIREGTVAIDSIGLSLSLPSQLDFQCIPSSSATFINANESLHNSCHHIGADSSLVPCTKWTYSDASLANTLTVEFDLICDRKTLGSLLMTIYFVGVLLGNIFWGYFSDRFGRWKAHSLCHILALLASAISLASPTIYFLLLLRFFAAFSSSGYQVLYTIQIETLGSNYRTFSSTANHLGWGFGTMMLAFIGINTNNWKYIAAICPTILLLSLPWMLFMPESIRWLKVDGRYEAARREIKRAARLNFMPHEEDGEFDLKIDDYLRHQRSTKKSNQHPKTKMLNLFRHRLLLLNLVTLWSALLFTNFIYFIRTLYFSMDKRSIFANFIISGLSEWVCLLVSVTFMVIFKRKTCLSFFIGVTGFTYIIEASLQISDPCNFRSSFVVATTLDCFAKVSCVSATIILFLVAYEVFPTELRNYGASIIMTSLGISGVIAPFSPNFVHVVGGLLNYYILLSIISFSLSTFLVLLVTETKNVDVTDTVEQSTDQSSFKMEEL